jgi:hypothetical protein
MAEDDGLDPAGWTGIVDANPPRVAPPPQMVDILRSESDRLDVFGQRAVAETLYSLCYSALTANSGRSERRTIALKGRYGQGKTTVLGALERRFSGRWILNRVVRVARFDIAAHKPDALSFEFDLLIAHWYTWRRWALYLFLAITLLIGFEILSRSLSDLGAPTLTTALTGVALTGSFAGILFFIRRLQAMATAESPMWNRPALLMAFRFVDIRRFVAELAENLGGRPDILLVDNLDRATVDQQKAFLRSLRRYRDSLPSVVVVAFDETPLALSDDSPETPRELLEKTFNTALSLYPMTAKDAIDIAMLIAGQITNASENLPTYLAYLPILGDFARVLLLHQRHSVRSCKQFANEVLAAAHVLDLRHPADFSALLRLQGLFVLLPWIQDDPAALAEFIAADDVDGLTAYAESIAQKPLSEPDRARVARYLSATRHMQPYFAGWRHFTGRFVANPERNNAASPSFWMPPARLNGPGSVDGILQARRWLEFDLSMAAEKEPARRQAAYLRAMRTLPSKKGESFDALCTWPYLLHRLWYADACLPSHVFSLPLRQLEPFLLFDEFLKEVSTTNDDTRVRQRVAEAFLQLLPSAKCPELLARSQAAVFIAGDLFAAGAPARDAQSLRVWLDACSGSISQATRDLFMGVPVRTGRTSNSRILELSWPANGPSEPVSRCLERLQQDLAALSALWQARAEVNFSTIVGECLASLSKASDNEGRIATHVMTAFGEALPDYVEGGEGGWELAPGGQLRELLSGSLDPDDVARWFRDVAIGARSAPWWQLLYLALLCGESEAAEALARRIGPANEGDIGFVCGLLQEVGRTPESHSSVTACIQNSVVQSTIQPSAAALRASPSYVHRVLAEQLPRVGL